MRKGNMRWMRRASDSPLEGYRIVEFDEERHEPSILRALLERVQGSRTALEGDLSDIDDIRGKYYGSVDGANGLFLVVEKEGCKSSSLDPAICGCGAVIVGAAVVETQRGPATAADARSSAPTLGALRRICFEITESRESKTLGERVETALVQRLVHHAEDARASNVISLVYDHGSDHAENAGDGELTSRRAGLSIGVAEKIGFRKTATTVGLEATQFLKNLKDALPPSEDGDFGRDRSAGISKRRAAALSSNVAPTPKPQLEPRWKTDKPGGRQFRVYRPSAPPTPGTQSAEEDQRLVIPRSGDLLVIVPSAVILILGISFTFFIALLSSESAQEVVEYVI